MSDPFAKTRYRVAQHWRFRTDTPEARDTFVITSVEDHPTQGIICGIRVEYDPPFRMNRNTFTGGGEYCFTQSALDASVTELVAERGPYPRHLGTLGDFTRDPASWGPNPYPFADTRTVGEVVAEGFARLVQMRDEEASRPPYLEPPAEALGLWSLIAHNKVSRLREILEQHPSLADEPLPQDPSDEYRYTGDEYEECYPLMLTAEIGSVEVAKLLLEFGADVRRTNKRGDTALHFSGKARSGGCGADEIARLLCERGVDPNAANIDGKSPLTWHYCMTEVAAVLVEFGATLNLNHALQLGKLGWVREQLRDNPRVVADAPHPRYVFDHLGYLLGAAAGHGFGVPWSNDLASMQRRADVQKKTFDAHRDLYEGALARGAEPDAGSALFCAVQLFDTSLAEWLLDHGADPNRNLKRGTAIYMPDVASTRRMINLLKRYGAVENPYPHEADEWEQERLRLKELFV